MPSLPSASATWPTAPDSCGCSEAQHQFPEAGLGGPVARGARGRGGDVREHLLEQFLRLGVQRPGRLQFAVEFEK